MLKSIGGPLSHFSRPWKENVWTKDRPTHTSCLSHCLVIMLAALLSLLYLGTRSRTRGFSHNMTSKYNQGFSEFTRVNRFTAKCSGLSQI